MQRSKFWELKFSGDDKFWISSSFKSHITSETIIELSLILWILWDYIPLSFSWILVINNRQGFFKINLGHNRHRSLDHNLPSCQTFVNWNSSPGRSHLSSHSEGNIIMLSGILSIQIVKLLALILVENFFGRINILFYLRGREIKRNSP